MSDLRQEKERYSIIQKAQEELVAQGFVRWDAMSEQQQMRLEILAARVHKLQLLGGSFADVRLAPELEAALADMLVEETDRSAVLVH